MSERLELENEYAVVGIIQSITKVMFCGGGGEVGEVVKKFAMTLWHFAKKAIKYNSRFVERLFIKIRTYRPAS